MALDTKYRPLNYDDVLGQDAHKAVLRQFVKEGKGFHQSYVFCGQHGSGKTTMGRILARALLCENPSGGDPCDECSSCRILLAGGSHEGFEELDAASKSGKGDLAKIIEDLSYATFSGSRRIYLFDESHRLSKAALDILLKPMEDCVEGSEDKQLICIFCTTEPEKMRSTIFSRCAPAFVIRAVEPEKIAERLAWVCDQEEVKYDQSALVTIAEVTECHIRDALKTVEGVSMLGEVNKDHVTQYLQLGANDLALDVLESIGKDLTRAVEISTKMAMEVSPSSAYERVAEAAMCAYRAHLGVGKVPSYWASGRVQGLVKRGAALLGVASRFSAPPHRPTRHTLILDVATAHYAVVSGTPPSKAASLVLEVQGAPSGSSTDPEVSGKGKMPETNSQPAGSVPDNEPEEAHMADGVWIDPRGIGKGPIAALAEELGTAGAEDTPPPVRYPGALPPSTFRDLVRHHLKEMGRGRTGQPR